MYFNCIEFTVDAIGEKLKIIFFASLHVVPNKSEMLSLRNLSEL
jgi:hypothetical protein